MWSTLRSDLTEFVSTVTNDTTEALNRMDESFPDAEGDLKASKSDTVRSSTNNNSVIGNKTSSDELNQSDDELDRGLVAETEECVRRMKLKETFTTPLLQKKKEDSQKESSEEEAPSSGENVGDRRTCGDREDGATNDDNEDECDDEVSSIENEDDIRAFLESFSLDSSKNEIAAALEDYPDTVKVWFDDLVPKEVTEEEFWQRYFYRCDPERVAAEWEADEERTAANRSQAVKLGLNAVSNFFGGAVQAVSASLAEDDVGENVKSEDGTSSARRPPFVMSADSADEDEEEVELGWDDDDDDDDDDEEDTHEVEFNDPAVEKLQEQLRVAIEERDLLHQTVEMQSKEIAALQEATSARGEEVASTAASCGSDDKEMDKLRTQLFEKDAELAALRASMLDNSRSSAVESPQHEALQKEVRRLSLELNDSESRCKQASALLSKAKEDIDKANSQTEFVELQLKQVNVQKAQLEASLEAQKSETLAVQTSLEAFQERSARLEKELQAMQERLAKQHQVAATTATVEGEESVDSPMTQGTVSSAVKVEAPTSAGSEQHEVASTDDGEGWDDDW